MKPTVSKLVMCLICACMIVPLAGCSPASDHISLPATICGRSPAELQGLVDAISQGELSDAQWDDVVGAVDSTDQEWYAATIYSTLPPEAVATLAWRLSAQYSWPVTAPASYFSRIRALGELLGTATRSTCAPLPTDYASDVVSVLERNPSPLPVAMSTILAHGQYDPPFALTIATQISQYETTPGFSWQNVAEEPNQIHMIADDGSWRTDAMPGILTMLATAPDAAQEFFTTGDTTPLDGYGFDVNSRLDHLIRDRSWASYSDEGAGLGAALESAATTYRTFDSRGQTSASLATQIFALVGNRTNNHWQMPTGMRAHMAAIVASYMPDLLTASDYPATIADFSSGGVLYQTKNNDLFPGFPAGAKFTNTDMNAILQTLGEDRDNVAILGVWWAIVDTAYIACELGTFYSDPASKGMLIQSTKNTGPFLNSLIPGSDVLKDIVIGAANGVGRPVSDQVYRAQLTSEILRFPAALPVLRLKDIVQSETMADWVYGQAQVYADKWLSNPHPYTGSDNSLTSFNDGISAGVGGWLFGVLYDLGFFDQDVVDWINADAKDEYDYSVPPDEIFTDSTRTQFSDGLSDWYSSGGGSGAKRLLIQTNWVFEVKS